MALSDGAELTLIVFPLQAGGPRSSDLVDR